METLKTNVLKFNHDAHFDISTCRGCIGVVCRDDKEKVITGFTWKIFVSSAMVAEALVLREVVSLAINLSPPCVLFESDCLERIEACKRKLVRKGIENIIEDIQKMRDEFTSIGFLWIKCKESMVADLIAKLALPNSLPRKWSSTLPLAVANLLEID